MNGNSCSFWYDDESEVEDYVIYEDAPELPRRKRIQSSPTVLAEVNPSEPVIPPTPFEAAPPTNYEDEGPVGQKRRIIEQAEGPAILDEGGALDYDNIELVHNPDDPYGLAEMELIIPSPEEKADGSPEDDEVQIIDDNNAVDIVNVGPNLETDVEIIVDENNNAAIRRHDMIAKETRSWKQPIVDGSQFYRHKSLRPPDAGSDWRFVRLYERVVEVLVTRRNIQEFRVGSKNVYIKLISPRLSSYWEDLRKQAIVESNKLYAEHGEKRLQTFPLPDVMQKFADGNVMTYKDFHSLLPGGKVI